MSPGYAKGVGGERSGLALRPSMERERDRVDKVMARNAMELKYSKKKLKLKGGDRKPTALLEEGDPFQIPNDS